MKAALYCPRLPDEAESDHKARYQACRLYFRNLPNVDVMEFDNLEDLQRHHVRQQFRRIVVARLGYYPMQLTEWACRSGISVTDVIGLMAKTTPSSGQPTFSSRCLALAQKEERMKARFA